MAFIAVLLLTILVPSQYLITAADHKNSQQYAAGTTGNVVIDSLSPGSQAGRSSVDGTPGTGTFAQGAFRPATPQGSPQLGINTGNFGQAGSGTRPDVLPGTSGINVGSPDIRFRQGGIGGSGFSPGGQGIGGSGFAPGGQGIGGSGFAPGGQGIGGSGFAPGGRPGAFGSAQGATRVIEAPRTFTVTKTSTVDHFVTLTDLAYHSIPVTLTDLVVRTTTLSTGQVIRTPVDDRVALKTTVIIRPTSLTVTCSKYYYNIVTEVSIDHVTITHSSYIIKQVTYTTTATQVLTYPSTMVRTIVRTQRTILTDYRTITNTIHGSGGYYY